MLTDDEKRKLIAEARDNVERAASASSTNQAERIRAGESGDDRLRLLVRLADALEGTLPEAEWEYGTAHRATPEYGASEYSRERAEERVREWNETTQSERGLLVRRRKAGPWEVVPDV